LQSVVVVSPTPYHTPFKKSCLAVALRRMQHPEEEEKQHHPVMAQSSPHAWKLATTGSLQQQTPIISRKCHQNITKVLPGCYASRPGALYTSCGGI